MTSLDVVPHPSHQAVTKSNQVTGKVAKAIEALVWLGLHRAEAAEKAGLSEHGLYKALRRPAVKAAYLAECEVLRTSGRARRIHRLEEMVEQDDNKAAVVNAALALERLGENEDIVARRGSVVGAPGLLIQIINQNGPNPQALPATIEHEPTE